MEYNENFYIWEGFYDTFSDVPSVGDGFDQDHWAEKIGNPTKELVSFIRKNDVIYTPFQKTSFLPSILSTLINIQDLRVLDFGGGVGIDYARCLSSFGRWRDISNKLRYSIVENATVCEKGKEIFNEDSFNIDFYSSFPDEFDADIVYTSSSLQYIDVWKSLLNCFVSSKPEYLIFNDLAAGDIPTFITAQNYYESKMPVRFLNVAEFIKAVEELGYSLIHSSINKYLHLGKYPYFPMDNFPEQYRLKEASNLAFKRR